MYRIFISHGSEDSWVASQIARRVRQDAKAEPFLDVYDIAKGDDFESRIFDMLPQCDELIALLTPWSVNRNWVWTEIGAARVLEKGLLGFFMVLPSKP